MFLFLKKIKDKLEGDRVRHRKYYVKYNINLLHFKVLHFYYFMLAFLVLRALYWISAFIKLYATLHRGVATLFIGGYYLNSYK